MALFVETRFVCAYNGDVDLRARMFPESVAGTRPPRLATGERSSSGTRGRRVRANIYLSGPEYDVVRRTGGAGRCAAMRVRCRAVPALCSADKRRPPLPAPDTGQSGNVTARFTIYTRLNSSTCEADRRHWPQLGRSSLGNITLVCSNILLANLLTRSKAVGCLLVSNPSMLAQWGTGAHSVSYFRAMAT